MNLLTRIAHILLRIAAGLTVIAVIAGPIALMALVAGNPLDPELLGALGDRTVDTDQVIGLLSIAFYVVWAWFAIPAIRQAGITLTRRPSTRRTKRPATLPARRTPTAMPADEAGPRGWLARLVRFALGAATVATTLTPAVTVGWTPTVTAAPVTFVHEAGDDTSAHTPAPETADASDRANAVSHTTAQRRDTPYAIARRLFPDNVDQARDDIVELNHGRRTPNGSQWAGGNFPAGMTVITPYHTTDSEPTDPGGDVTYTVRPNDGWINVVEALWGPNSGHRWQALRAQLIGQTVAPGVTITPDTDIIHPGWTFTRPNELAGPVATSVVVEAGDTIYDLIDDVIDEPVTAHHIASVARHNDGTATPDGRHVFDATNPDLIHPGQLFDLTPAIDHVHPTDDRAEPPTNPPATSDTMDPADDDAPADPIDATASEPTVHNRPPHGDPDADVASSLPAPTVTSAPTVTDAPATPNATDTPWVLTETPTHTDAPATPPITRPAPPIPIPTDSVAANEPQPGDVAATPPTIRDERPPSSGGDDPASTAPFALLGAAGLALAGLFTALDRRRRRARTRRPTGTTIAPPDPAQAATEHAIRRAAHIDRATRVNLAVRQLGIQLAERDTPLRAHHLLADDTEVTVVFGHPVDLGANRWTPSDDHHRWTCTIGDDDLHQFADDPTPWPALTPIGTLDDGADVLIDLEATGIFTITGPDDQTVHAVITATITAISASPYADLLTCIDTNRVDLHGLARHLDNRLIADTADTVVDRLHHWIAPFDFDHQHLLAARHHAGSEYEPCIAVIVGALTDQQRERLGDLPLNGSHPIAVITTDPTLAGLQLELDDDGTTDIGGLRVRCHRLEIPAAQATATLFDDVDVPNILDTPPFDEYERLTGSITAEPAQPDVAATPSNAGETPAATEPNTDLAPSATNTPIASGMPSRPAQLFDTEPDVDWTVRVLGPLEIIHTDGTQLNGPRVRELATLLAMHPNGLTTDRVKDMLGNHSASITTRVSELRKLLGRGDTVAGRTHLPTNSGARGYHLEGVRVDSVRLARCLDHSRTTTGHDKINWLVGALELVRGPIGTGELITYDWASHLMTTLEATIVEAGVELAHLAAEHQQWAIVDWAATQTRLANPYEQRLLPLQIDARRHLGNDHTIRRLHDDALDDVDQFEPDVQAAFHTALARQAR